MARPLPLLLALTSVAACGIAAESPSTKEAPLKVFLLIGTSNMHGKPAAIEDLPAHLREPRKELLGCVSGRWVPLEPGKNIFGNETAFGEAMSKHFNQPIGIIKIPGVRSVAGNAAQILEKSALARARKSDRGIVITGMLLDVSYGDGMNEERARAYAENLPRWIESARREIGNAVLPIVMNRAIPPVRGHPSFLDVVRRAQDAFELPAFRVFDCDDVPKRDKVHFTTEGQLEMGRRFAAAMIELLEKQE